MSRSGHDVTVVGTFEMPSGTAFSAHVHDQHQIVWATSGVLRTAVGRRSWVLPRTRALWVPAGVAHAQASIGDCVMRSVYVDPPRAPVRWSEPTPILASALFAELVDRLGGDALSPAQRRRTEAVLLDVLIPVDIAVVGPPMPTDARAREVAAALEARPDDQRTLEEWAVAVGASTRTLTRAFARETGMGFARWREEVRMQAAVRLLATGTATTRIAPRVGYSSPSAFVAAFRRSSGVTPGEYFATDPSR